MAADPKLIEVARAAEHGATLPLLRLSTAGQLIIGRPGPSSEFNEAIWDPIIGEIGQQIRKSEGTGWTKKAAQQKAEAAGQRWEAEADRLREGWGPAAIAPEPDPPENLTLFNAVVWGWGESSGLRVPTVRVRLDGVTAWWAGSAEVIKGATTGGWFAFVSLPIPTGN